MRTNTQRSQAGYTLLEVMIAILILTIGFLALIAVQLGSLNGYVSARDNAQGTEVGRGLIEIAKTQALQWQKGTYSSGSDPYATDTPTDNTDPLGVIAGGGSTWTPMFNTPANVAMFRKSVDANLTGGKFCAYMRGNQLAGAPDNSTYQVQVAVVYPGPNAKLNDCVNDITLTDLDDVGSGTAPPTLEAQGYRVDYFASVIVRRSFLAKD